MKTKKTGKRLLVLALALAMCITSLVVPTSAAEKEVNVRVNGYLVNFPDQKPTVNSDGRTLIPVRFVAEELGAKVTWDSKQKAAVIEKDGQTITVPINKNILTVTDADGKTSTVTMDTKTILKNGRTLVPIRFVAEAMGCYVDFSSSFQTVEIYKDVLTADEIKEIRSLPFGFTFCEGSLKYKESPTTFADMSELAFQPTTFAVDWALKSRNSKMTWDSKKDSVEKLANLYVDNAKAKISGIFSYEPYGVHATFRTDASAIVNNPAVDSALPYIIYGYLTLTFDNDANIAAYKALYKGADIGNVQAGKSYTYLFETYWIGNAVLNEPMYHGAWDRTNGIREQWG